LQKLTGRAKKEKKFPLPVAKRQGVAKTISHLALNNTTHAHSSQPLRQNTKHQLTQFSESIFTCSYGFSSQLRSFGFF